MSQMKEAAAAVLPDVVDLLTGDEAREAVVKELRTYFGDDHDVEAILSILDEHVKGRLGAIHPITAVERSADV